MKNATFTALFLATLLFNACVALYEHPYESGPLDGGSLDRPVGDCNYIRDYDAAAGCINRCVDPKNYVWCSTRNGQEWYETCQDGWYCCNAQCLIMPGHDAGYEGGGVWDTGIPSHSYRITGGRVSFTMFDTEVVLDSTTNATIEGSYSTAAGRNLFYFEATTADLSQRITFDIQPVVTIGLETSTRMSIIFNSVGFGTNGTLILGTIDSFQEVDTVWIGSGIFSGTVRQDPCCSGGYDEFADVTSGTFEMTYEMQY